MPEMIAPKVMSWASILDDGTREQAQTASQMPFIYPHLALMPDAHLGKGATVGSVIPTRGAIMPAAVGVDIGCGMNAVRTNLTVSDIEGFDLSALRHSIESAIPLSPGKYNHHVADDAASRVAGLEWGAEFAGFNPDDYAPNWRLQLGSLGGGNHFIEVCADEHDHIWLFLHSGSRGIGNKIAQHHIKVAQDYCERHFINLPDKDLAYLVEGTVEFDRYIAELGWAQKFAYYNREVMMSRVWDCLVQWVGTTPQSLMTVNCHHNYTVSERHYGSDVWLSRKGAINAGKGVHGLIPGSMGDRSYVVVGKGNPVSLNSAPHGAGRVHSRSAARKAFTQDDLRERMAGIEYRDDAAFIDEIPDAYKPIDQVMEDSADLVEVLFELRQLVNVKGQ